MNFNKGDIITGECGCIGTYLHKDSKYSAFVDYIYLKCSGGTIETRCVLDNPILSTEEEVLEFKKKLISAGYKYNNKTRKVERYEQSEF